MQTITLELPDELVERLNAEAVARSRTPSQVVASSLQALPSATDDYWKALEDFRAMIAERKLDFDTANRLTRDEANARR